MRSLAGRGYRFGGEIGAGLQTRETERAVRHPGKEATGEGGLGDRPRGKRINLVLLVYGRYLKPQNQVRSRES